MKATTPILLTSLIVATLVSRETYADIVFDDGQPHTLSSERISERVVVTGGSELTFDGQINVHTDEGILITDATVKVDGGVVITDFDPSIIARGASSFSMNDGRMFGGQVAVVLEDTSVMHLTGGQASGTFGSTDCTRRSGL